MEENKYTNIFYEIINEFEKYHFIIDKKSQGINPEILGTIFENILKNENNLERDPVKKSIVYTPNEIVKYMCRESIIEYLIRNSNFKDVQKKYISDLVKHLSDYNLKEIFCNKFSIYEIKELDNLLKNVKIFDPSIGSGVFPVEMVILISDLRFFLYDLLGSPKSKYEIKLECIEKCIYGCDIDEEAIDIAKLRLWLIMVFDDSNNQINLKIIRPFTSLEFKIINADTLTRIISKQHKVESYNLYLRPDINILKDLKYKKEAYQHIICQLEKGKLLNEIKCLKNDVYEKILSKKEKNRDIDIEIEFSEILLNDNENGFNIIIGNPPYINVSKLNLKVSKEYKRKYLSAYNNYDIYYLFLERSFDLCHEYGIINFIMPYGYIKNNSGKKLLKDVLFKNEKSHIYKILSFGSNNIFKNASVRVAIQFFLINIMNIIIIMLLNKKKIKVIFLIN